MKKKQILAALAVGGIFTFSPTVFNFSIPNYVYAEVGNYTASEVAMLDFGENDEKIIAEVKRIAKMRAEIAAKEKAGVWLKSFSKTVNGVLNDEEIFAVSSNISEILKVDYEKHYFQAEDAKGKISDKKGYFYKAIVTVKVDSAGISDFMSRQTQEKTTIVRQNKNLRRSLMQIDNNFEEFRKVAENKTPEQIQADLDKINKELESAEKISEGNKLSYQKDYSAAISKYAEAAKLNPSSTLAYENIETMYDKNEDNINQIIKSLDEEIKKSPKSAELYYERGIAYNRLGEVYGYFSKGLDEKNYKFAQKDFDKAIELNKDNIQYYFWRGKNNYDMSHYKRAIMDFDKLIEINPKNASYYAYRGKSHYQLHHYKKAVEDFDKATDELHINDAWCYYYRGHSYHFIAMHYRYEDDRIALHKLAVNDYKKALQLDPSIPKYYFPDWFWNRKYE